MRITIDRGLPLADPNRIRIRNGSDAALPAAADARLIWAVDAATWDEAQTAKHVFLGLEPYRPMDPEPDSPNPTP